MTDFIEAATSIAQNGEPFTVAEIKQDQVARLIREAWLASSELFRLRAQDREAASFITTHESDLWSIKTRIDTLIDEIRAENNERPLPGPQGLRLVGRTRR